MKKSIFILTILIATFPLYAQKQTWTLDKSNSSLGFVVTHLMVSEVEGYFKTFDITLESSGNDFSGANVQLTANTNSISTNNENRDNDLKSDHFFDAAKYPTLEFKSTSFKKISDKQYKLEGNLTMHGVTKPVELNVRFNGTIQHPMTKKTIAGFKVTGNLKRSDFKIGMNLPVAVVEDEVQIVANTEFIKD